MNIFVTGGAGYVGSHCVRGLCDAGHTVVVYDNLVSGGHREAVDVRAKLIVGDLADTRLLDGSLARGRSTSRRCRWRGSPGTSSAATAGMASEPVFGA